MSKELDAVFLSLQAYIVAFLLFHDWIPLGKLNNLGAIRREDSLVRSVVVTLLPGVPAGIGLYYCARYFAQPYPEWLTTFLWVTYGTFLTGILWAWWIPYLVIPDPKRAARYQEIFAGTHAFLPMRNGIVPDTLHTTFHAVVAVAVVVLLLR